MPFNHQFDGVSHHIDNTLRWSHFCMSWFPLHSHHKLNIFLLFPDPVEMKNRREDLHVIVCLLVHPWAYYALSKFGNILMRYHCALSKVRLAKVKYSGILARWLRHKLKGTSSSACSRRPCYYMPFSI